MPDIHDSIPTELPSSKQLLRSTIIAILVAAVLLFGVVMPAEYGVDPTGVGGLLGLTEMGKIKQSLAGEARLADAQATAPAAPAIPVTPSTTPAATTVESTTAAAGEVAAASKPRSDSATVELAPNQGREIKLEMRQGARVKFSWSTDKGVVNYDTHADSKVPKRDYYGYEKGTGKAKQEGELVAAFDGWHGWFWRNRGKETLTVTLRTEGEYTNIKEPE